MDSGLVFTSTIGTALDERNVRRSFKTLLHDAGLPNMRLHDLRHTTATLLLGQGVHPRVVMETLGHSQVSLTLDTYSHVLPSLQEEAAKQLDAAIGCQIGCQSDEEASDGDQNVENSLEKVVSRLGIEPRTRRLRGAPEIGNDTNFRAFLRIVLAECGNARHIAVIPAQPRRSPRIPSADVRASSTRPFPSTVNAARVAPSLNACAPAQ